MTLAVDVRHRLGAFELDVAFESGGGLTALFGPSGSGKTSLVNIIGGLIRPDSGRVAVDGRLLVDRERRLFVPRHKRRIGYVFQDARLFPHLTVSQNLRFGRFFAPAADRYAAFGEVVEMLGIGHLLERRPNLLSGGEKQRVAIGRALLASPRLILMDEPLASLDEARKAEIIPYIERLRDEIRVPIVYVSHSLSEVARLANEVILLSAGRVAAAGPAEAVLSRFDLLPQDQRAEAGSLVELTLVEQDDGYGLSVLRSGAGEWRLRRVDGEPGSTVRVRVRARDVMIATERPEGISALNVLPAVVSDVTEDAGGSEAVVLLDSAGDRLAARITRRSASQMRLKPGMPVFAVVKSVTFDAAGAVRPPRLS
jgi:molybdate transport system ATP-binding protein